MATTSESRVQAAYPGLSRRTTWTPRRSRQSPRSDIPSARFSEHGRLVRALRARDPVRAAQTSSSGRSKSADARRPARRLPSAGRSVGGAAQPEALSPARPRGRRPAADGGRVRRARYKKSLPHARLRASRLARSAGEAWRCSCASRTRSKTSRPLLRRGRSLDAARIARSWTFGGDRASRRRASVILPRSGGRPPRPISDIKAASRNSTYGRSRRLVGSGHGRRRRCAAARRSRPSARARRRRRSYPPRAPAPGILERGQRGGARRHVRRRRRPSLCPQASRVRPLGARLDPATPVDLNSTTAAGTAAARAPAKGSCRRQGDARRRQSSGRAPRSSRWASKRRAHAAAPRGGARDWRRCVRPGAAGRRSVNSIADDRPQRLERRPDALRRRRGADSPFMTCSARWPP